MIFWRRKNTYLNKYLSLPQHLKDHIQLFLIYAGLRDDFLVKLGFVFGKVLLIIQGCELICRTKILFNYSPLALWSISFDVLPYG